MACIDARTTDGFKSQFSRDFPYLPTWDNTQTYNTGNEVYYATTKLFYRALNDGVTSTPDTVADWEQFSDSIENYVLDNDITKAFLEAKFSFNEGLVGGVCDEVLHVYYYLVAHYLVMDIQASQSGLANSGKFLVASKSAGSVSVSYSIPESYLKDPILSYYTKTDYGMKYLSVIMPKMVGNMFAVAGMSRP